MKPEGQIDKLIEDLRELLSEDKVAFSRISYIYNMIDENPYFQNNATLNDFNKEFYDAEEERERYRAELERRQRKADREMFFYNDPNYNPDLDLDQQGPDFDF